MVTLKPPCPGSEAAAICFSLPVTAVEGMRRIDPEDEKDDLAPSDAE